MGSRVATGVVGVLIGTTLAWINLLTGLKAGVWDTGQLTAGFLSVLLLGRLRSAPLQHAGLAATLGASMGAMPATLGLLAAVPAAALAGHPLGTLDVAVLGVLLGLFGVALAGALAPALIDEERLPFPSGAATAELMTSFSQRTSEGPSMARPFLAALGLAVLITLLRDAAGVLPGALEATVTVGGLGLGVGLAFSPMLLGTGSLIGPRLGLSLIAGAVLAWLVGGSLAPPRADVGALGEWLRWSGAALLVGASVPATVRTLRLLRQGTGWSRRYRAVVVGSGLAAAAFVWLRLDVALPLALASVVLAGLLGTVTARAAGATDVAPLSDVGQVAMTVGAAGQGAQAGLLVGQVTAGSGAQVTGALWNRRIGKALGLSLEQQLWAQALGVVLGVGVAMGAFAVMTRTTPLGSKELPAPSGAQWAALTGVLTRGLDALPPGALPAALGAAVLGLLLALLEPKQWKWLPSPMGLGLAFLLPPTLSLTLAVGALLGGWGRARRGELVSSAVGAGLLAGEAIPSVVLAAIAALRG